MKTTTLKHKFQEGFSLVQGLILTAVISGAAVIGTQQIQDQKLAQKRSQIKGEIGLLHDTIYSTLQNRDHCSGTLNLPANNTAGFAKELVSIASKEGNILFTVNPNNEKIPSKTYMNGNVSIKRMSIEDSGSDGLMVLTIEYNRFKITKTQTSTGSTIKERIQLKIQKDPINNEFVGCYAVKNYSGDSGSNEKQGNTNSLKDFCLSLGSLVKWNEQYQTCTVKKNICSDSQKLFIGMNSDGEAICKSIFDQMPFNELIDSSSVICDPPNASSVKFVQAGDKVKVDCGSSPYTPPVETHFWRRDTNNCKPVSGGWSAISWSPCTTGPNPTKTGTKTCTNPAPSCGGENCKGTSTVTESCSCVPAKTCAEIESETCIGEDAGKDSCGNQCDTSGSKVCKKDCTPEKSCAEIRASVCVGESAGFDSCENDCLEGELNDATCTKPKKVKCQVNWCHLSVKRSATCYEDNSFDSMTSGGSCSDENGGGVPCNKPEFCGACVPDASCAELEATTCSYATGIRDSCGKACSPGVGKKDCNKTVIGTKLTRMDTGQEYWTSTKLSSGDTMWSGGAFCYMSQGPIYEIPPTQEIFGTPVRCTPAGPEQ